MTYVDFFFYKGETRLVKKKTVTPKSKHLVDGTSESYNQVQQMEKRTWVCVVWCRVW